MKRGKDNVAVQLASLRKSFGISQGELAKRVGTSQQQISRLESPSYKGHSLRMLRRVSDVLGATIRVEILRDQNKNLRKRSEFAEFERDFLREDKVDIIRNFRIVKGLYREAVALGVIPLKNPLDGIEVDLKIAKAVNRV